MEETYRFQDEFHKPLTGNKIDLPIGIMDSGLGGLSVMKEALRIMPQEDFIYFGDSANAPYGTKPREEIKRLTYGVVEKLLDMGIKGLAVACNTATSAAVKSLREDYPDLPLVGIEPAVKPAVEHSEGGRIIIMATPMTIAQEKLRHLIDQYRDQADLVPVACDGLMEFVERGDFDGRELDGYFEERLLPLLTDNTESIVLGCTHYPFLKPHLRAFLGDRRIELIDGSLGTARELRRRLAVQGLLKPEGGQQGVVTILNSAPGEEKVRMSKKLLQMDISDPGVPEG